MGNLKKATYGEISASYKDENEDFTLAKEDLDDSWRHGNYVTQVWMRVEDGSFWQVTFRVSGDGETNEMRDLEKYEVAKEALQVVPKKVLTTVYEAVK